MTSTQQEKAWSGKFGKNYTDRNILSPEELDQLYIDRYSFSRTNLNKEFIENKIKKNNKILEIGCNIGNQLAILQKMGYKNLWGIELQDYAVEMAKERMKDVNIIKSSAFDIPFKDSYFDLVFTSGLLIHISPKDINNVLDEIYRCSNSYIWGLEYFIPEGYETVIYRGNDNLLWKTDFSKLFLERFADLKLVHKKLLKYHDSDNLDLIYLLKKI
jgi:pseudaminic acid biosynthesis-associated methylase